MNKRNENILTDIVKVLPSVPGVYLFKDQNSKVIYVGKAKNLKKRVSSYFSKKTGGNNKLKILVKQIRIIDHIVVETESDALLLENNLIKEYQPRYNVLLKDDKSYPYICVKNEPFPRVFSTRNPVKDGSAYFGPYTSGYMVRTLLDLIRQLYPLRNCNYNLSESNIMAGKFKVCLEYHIGNCKGPCVGKQPSVDYEENIKQIKLILKGNIQGVKLFLKNRMKQQAEKFEFEAAQYTKEKLDYLEKYQSKSTVVNPLIANLDVFSFIDYPKFAVSNFVKVVDGAVIKSQTIEIKKVLSEDKTDLLARVIVEIRSREINNSNEILVPFIPSYVFPGVKYSVPLQGDKKRLLILSERNAKYYLNEKEKKQFVNNSQNGSNRILESVRLDLRLKVPPVHIECFDNSNIQGKIPVSACVVFRNGRPSKKEYRHYNIRTVSGPDDYASMKEVVYRRYKRLIDEKMTLPQLIVVDGGKSQLSAGFDALDALNLTNDINIISIAKRLEEIFFPGDPVPLYLDKRSESLKLIQHLRNEAHRFSIMFHRDKRSSGFARSVLQDITGLGEKTVEKLYRHFRTYNNICNASYDDLVPVIGKAKARILIDHLSKI